MAPFSYIETSEVIVVIGPDSLAGSISQCPSISFQSLSRVLPPCFEPSHYFFGPRQGTSLLDRLMKVFPNLIKLFFGSQGKCSVVTHQGLVRLSGDQQRDCKVSMSKAFIGHEGNSLPIVLDRLAMVSCDEVHPTPVNQGLGLLFRGCVGHLDHGCVVGDRLL